MDNKKLQPGPWLERNSAEATFGSEESAVPIYVLCPHCEHPAVLPAAVHGRCYRCRQCNGYYVIQMTQSRRSRVESDLRSSPENLKRAV